MAPKTPKTPEPPCQSPESHKMVTAADGVPGEARTVSGDGYGRVPKPEPEESSRREPPRIWPAAQRRQRRTEQERRPTSGESPSGYGYGYGPTVTYGVMSSTAHGGAPTTYGVVGAQRSVSRPSEGGRLWPHASLRQSFRTATRPGNRPAASACSGTCSTDRSDHDNHCGTGYGACGRTGDRRALTQAGVVGAAA